MIGPDVFCILRPYPRKSCHTRRLTENPDPVRSEQCGLVASQAFDRALLYDRIPGQIVGCSDEQGRLRMVAMMVRSGRAVVSPDGITVDTAVQTAFVGPDVDTFDAVAYVALIFVLMCPDRIASYAFDQLTVDTQAARDTQRTQIDLYRAGVEPERITVSGLFERERHLLDLATREGFCFMFSAFTARRIWG